MDHIQFRGKRIDNNQWAYGYVVQGDKIGTLIMTGEYHVNSGTDAFQCYEVMPETVQQFTGLLDSRETPIYEGDIAICKYQKMAKIVWVEEFGCFG